MCAGESTRCGAPVTKARARARCADAAPLSPGGSRSWLGGWRGNAGGPPGRAKSYGELATAANILGGHYAFSGSVDTMKQKDIDNMLSHLDKAEKALALGI